MNYHSLIEKSNRICFQALAVMDSKNIRLKRNLLGFSSGGNTEKYTQAKLFLLEFTTFLNTIIGSNVSVYTDEKSPFLKLSVHIEILNQIRLKFEQIDLDLDT